MFLRGTNVVDFYKPPSRSGNYYMVALDPWPACYVLFLIIWTKYKYVTTADGCKHFPYFYLPSENNFTLNLTYMRVVRIDSRERPQAEPGIDLNLLDPLIQKYRNKKGNLIPLLQGAQDIYGYIPRDVFIYLSRHTGLNLSEMYGVATFYAQFRLQPVGKHIIKVCHGTACHVQNANAISEALTEALGIPDGGTTDDKLFTIESVACLGCCSLAPVMMIGDETYGKLTGKEAVRIVKDIRIREMAENGTME